jgi:hypothetical protein
VGLSLPVTIMSAVVALVIEIANVMEPETCVYVNMKRATYVRVGPVSGDQTKINENRRYTNDKKHD